MNKQDRKPAWWQLYLLLPAMFLLIGAEQVRPLPGVSEGIADVLIIAFTFGSMFVWVQSNAGRIERDYWKRDQSIDDLKITVYDPIVEREKNRILSHGMPPLSLSNMQEMDLKGESVEYVKRMSDQ